MALSKTKKLKKQDEMRKLHDLINFERQYKTEHEMS